MSTGILKSRSPVERSYSSASSTTSSRRSARRKRRRMKHTVMPLKKRADRQEVPCDVHRVSNLDIEEMEQSACFWVAKNADDPGERSFKEEVFVNKDAPSSDEDMSYYEEKSETRTTDEFSHESYKTRTDTSIDARHVNEVENLDENYVNDPNYSEEKTFYGVRKGRISDGSELEKVSPLPSPRNRSRISSYSDDGQSGFSSEGLMHVGWTSDVGISSGVEYEDSDGGEGMIKSREFNGYRMKDGDKTETEFPTRKIRQQNGDESNVVLATDITTTESTEAQNFEERKNEKLNGRVDREYYTKETMESSYSAHNGGRFDTGIITGGDFEPRGSDPRYYETSGEPFSSAKTSTPTGHVYPSSDTELVNFRSFEIDVERQSDRSLPLGGHKTKTQYYSVEDLMQAAKEEEKKVEAENKADSGSDGPEIPRTYEDYEPPDKPEDEHEIRRLYARLEPKPQGVPSSNVVNTQRPLLVPRKEKEFDGRGRENLHHQDGRPETNEYVYEESKEFYGYRRKKPEKEDKENLRPEYSKEKDSGHPPKEKNQDANQVRPKDVRECPVDMQVQHDDDRTHPEDDRRFEENLEFRGYRHPRDDVRQLLEKTSGDQSKNTELENTKEFYGYRTLKTGTQPGSEHPLYEKVSGKPPTGTSREHERQQSSGTTSRTVVTSSEYYGFKRTSSTENISKYGKGGQTKTTSHEVIGYRKTGSSENISGVGKERNGQKWETREVVGYRRTGSLENISSDGKKAEQSSEVFGFKSKIGSTENIPTDSTRGERDGQIWEESKEFFGFRRKQVVDGKTYVAEGVYQGKPRSPVVMGLEPNDERPRYLESREDVKRRDEELRDRNMGLDEQKEHLASSTQSNNLMSVDEEKYYDKNFEESREFYGYRWGEKNVNESSINESNERDRRMTESNVDDSRQYFGRNFEESKDFYGYRRGNGKDKPEEDITRKTKPENFMPVDDDNQFESKDFDGYRTGEDVPRSAAYDEYQRPDSRSENETLPGNESRIISSPSYDVTTKTTRYTERQLRETNATGRYSEPEIKESRTNDVNMKPSDYDSPRDRHMFNILEVPPSKKVIPLTSDVAPKTETTETMTKRLHTRSERDTLRREAKRPDDSRPEPIEPEQASESCDIGMKMFRERSLPRERSPRKHGYPTSSKEKTKELPRKITKKSDEPDLSQRDPDFAKRFQEVTDKRKKTAKTTTKTTETTTKSATESCNKNVDELVNVFNTLEHIQGKKSDKNAPPKVTQGERSDKPTAEDGKMSPASSVSQKLHQIENILDSVDRNSQKGTRGKPEDRQKKIIPSSRGKHSDTRRTTKTTTTRETTRNTRETTRDTHEETRDKYTWKPPNDDLITKQKAMDVEAFLEDEPSRGQHAGRGQPSEFVDRKQPWSYTDTRPLYRPERQPRSYDHNRSRDDDDEVYRAQIRKGREEKWRDSRPSRKKKYDSKSDGEIEGFKSRPFGDRVILPGTPVNIRLYGMNLSKTNQDRSSKLNWELLTNNKVPVDESVGRTQIKWRPLDDVGHIADDEMPVDETVGQTQLKTPEYGLEQLPKEEPRREEPSIHRSRSLTPTFDTDFPTDKAKDKSMREEQEPFYRRPERLPRKRDAPIAKSDSLDDDKVTLQEIKWSHPPISKVRPEKEPPNKILRSESPNSKEVMELDSSTTIKTNTETTRKNTRMERKTFEDQKPQPNNKTPKESLGKQSQEELSFEVCPTKEKPLESSLIERYPSMTPPLEKHLNEKRPSSKRPLRKSPSEERPDVKDKLIETNAEPDEHVIEIHYDQDDDHDILPEQRSLPEQNTLPEQTTYSREENVIRSSKPNDKPRPPGLNDDIPEDSHHRTHEESSSTERHESHETHVDHTIHTTRTTKTTRSETTETIVKTYRTGRPGSTRPENSEPDFIVPVSNEPDYSEPGKPDIASEEPEYFREPEYITPEKGQPEFSAPPQPNIAESQPHSSDEPSLVSHEYIEMNTDKGRPVNLTMLGRVVENDDEDELSSHSREDLFLHTRLKMVTEKKKMHRDQRSDDVDAHLLEPKSADQDSTANESEFTDSEDEFEVDDVAEQLLIPISRNIDKDIKKKKRSKPADTAEIFTPQEQVDEFVSKADRPRETITRNVLILRTPHKSNIEKEKTPGTKIPDFDFQEPALENVDFTEKPEKTGPLLEFGVPVDDNGVEKAHIDIVQLPTFDDFVAESAPLGEFVILPENNLMDEEISKDRKATPSLPELTYEPVDESITSEKQETDLNVSDIPDFKPVEPVDEMVDASTQARKGVYSPAFEEVFLEMRKAPTPELVDETVTYEERDTEVVLPTFVETRPSQPVDEDISQSKPIKKIEFVPDFKEFAPEPEKPSIPVDENVSSEKLEIELDLPELQHAEPECSEQIVEQVRADEPITSQVDIPDLSEIEFQKAVPEFPETNTVNEHRDVPVEIETVNFELPGFQEAVQEPVRNFATTESDLEVEGQWSSSSQDISDSEFDGDKDDAHKIDGKEILENDIEAKITPEHDNPEESTPEKGTSKKDSPRERSPRDESWSETIENKTVRETTTTETVTVEKTIKRYPSPQKKGEPVSLTKAGPTTPKDSAESSPEPSPQSSSDASADVGADATPEVVDTDKPETPKRTRRNRRGRFDDVKRSGSLVPESVVRDESPGPIDVSPVVPEREQPVSNEPDTAVSFFTPRQKIGQLRPEMYLLDSDDETQGEMCEPKQEAVAESVCVPVGREIPEEKNPEEIFPWEDEIPSRDDLSPELIDELLENEVQGLTEDDLGMKEETEVLEKISKEDKKQPDLREMPEDEPIDEKVDETVLPEEKPSFEDTPAEVLEEVTKSFRMDKPQLSDEEDGNLPQEEIEQAIKQEQLEQTPEQEEIDEDISKSVDERVPKDSVLPETTRQEETDLDRDETVSPEAEDFEIILLEHVSKDENVSDKDDDDVIDKDDDSTGKDDVVDKDAVIVDNSDVMRRKKDFLRKGESTVETVIVEKKHSEFSTTVTEITTKKYPRDIPYTTSDIPEGPREHPRDVEDEYVIIPVNSKSEEFVEPCKVKTVKGIPDDDQPPNVDSPTAPSDDFIPVPFVTKGPEDQQNSDLESSESRSSTTESDNEQTDSGVGKVVLPDTITDTSHQPTETVFGIVDIKYEKPKTEEIFILETNVEIKKLSEIPKKSTDEDSGEEVLTEDAPSFEDILTFEDVPIHTDQIPEKLPDVAIVPVDSSSEDEDKGVPQGKSETTVETIIVEKTSTQISTTITEITDESQETRKDLVVTFAFEGGTSSEAAPEHLPTPEDAPILEAFQSTREEKSEVDIPLKKYTPEKDISDDATAEKDSYEGDTSEKDTNDDGTQEKNNIMFNIKIKKETSSSSSSDESSTSDDEKESIPTIETIIIEKTSTQVSSSITKVAASSPIYPPPSPTYAQVIMGEIPTTELPITEAIPKSEFSPSFQGVPIPNECIPMVEDIPKKTEDGPTIAEEVPRKAEDVSMAEGLLKTEVSIYEAAPIMDYSERLVTEVLSGVQTEDVDGTEPRDDKVIKIRAIETQTEHYDVYSETTQTEDTTETTRRDAFSITPQRNLSDSENQTKILQGSVSAQTDSEDSQWYMYTQTVEELRESSENVTTESREKSDHETQTDVPGTHVTSERSSMTDDDLRVIPIAHEGTQTDEDREDRWEEEVTRITRRTTTETRTEESYERTETLPSRKDVKSDCPVCLQSLEATNYSFIKVRDLSRFTAMEERSSQYEEEGDRYSSTSKEEWRQSRRETDEYTSGVREEWEQDVVIQSGSSEVPGEAHLTIRIDGNEKCLLYCRRPGNHACALEKLASIIEAYRRATRSRNEDSGQSSEIGENMESVETVESDEGDGHVTSTNIVIGQQQRDVSVQTDGALLPADFEVFSDKDFEIYYDERKSPWFV